MSANIKDLLNRLSDEQKEGINQVLSELSEASLSLDPKRIEDAKEQFKKAFQNDQDSKENK